LNVVANAPVLLVVTSADKDGAEQLTGMEELMTPPSMTVGWLGSLLHSRTFPGELSVNPLPVSVTADPFIKPVSGDAVIVVPAAKADIVVPRRTAPATTSNDAPTKRYFARASRPPDNLLTTTSQSRFPGHPHPKYREESQRIPGK